MRSLGRPFFLGERVPVMFAIALRRWFRMVSETIHKHALHQLQIHQTDAVA